jgi:hypothetical protein
VELSHPSAHMIVFLRIALSVIITKYPEETTKSSFERLANLKEELALKEGLCRFLIQERERKKSTAAQSPDDELFRKRARVAQKILEKSISSNIFAF